MSLLKCGSCGKIIRGSGHGRMLSMSASGANCHTVLCKTCAHNEDTLAAVRRFNDNRLREIDGEL